MTLPELSSLYAAIKARRHECFGVGYALDEWLAANPLIPPWEARGAAMTAGRVPFPSVNGNPPVDRARPYYDARYWEKK